MFSLCLPLELLPGQRRRIAGLYEIEQRAGERPSFPATASCGRVAVRLSLWPALIRRVDDGRLEIDNNTAEQALRSVAVGRKNYLFAGSDAGERAAEIYAMIDTAKLSGINPHSCLTDVTAPIANHPARKLDQLMPFAVALIAATTGRLRRDCEWGEPSVSAREPDRRQAVILNWSAENVGIRIPNDREPCAQSAQNSNADFPSPSFAWTLPSAARDRPVRRQHSLYP